MITSCLVDQLLSRLFPICRCLAGSTNRDTLRILSEYIPLDVIEVPTGTKVFDWTIPREWAIYSASIESFDGQVLVDFSDCNLHIASHSNPVESVLTFEELKPHLYTSDVSKEAIPYRTHYYDDSWAFCVNQDQYSAIQSAKQPYSVTINSTFTDGSLSIGELVIKGDSSYEILISSYICHPSMANDSLSGVILSTLLAKELLKKKTKFTYRFVFCPETIGALAYSSIRFDKLQHIDRGLVITTVGGPGTFSYKQSYLPSDRINTLIEETLNSNCLEYKVHPFSVRGSDERQYSSPGLRINMASIFKDKYYEYDEYHTSLDNLEFVNASQIKQSLDVYIALINNIEKELIYKRVIPVGEPMLSKHGLYQKDGGAFHPELNNSNIVDTFLWILFYSDGSTSLQSISLATGIPFEQLAQAAAILTEKNLIEHV